LLNSFEANDKRKTAWLGSVMAFGNIYYFPYKYKSSNAPGTATEYLMIMRLAEQYLIRAEARANLSKIAEGLSDLNTIRTRAGLPDTTTNNPTQLLNLIYHERQVELFTELGQRWFDLKRTNTANTVMNFVTPLKGGTWQATDQLYPVPVADISMNPNLVQNPGY
jgi:hypothetical protein